MFSSRITRRESSGNPDVTGDQQQVMRSFLKANEQFKFVWFDFSCLPQRTRNSLEEAYFQTALKNVKLLYLHAHVFVIHDRDYNRRFWCNYETFFGCHKFNGTTFVGFWGARFSLLVLLFRDFYEYDDERFLKKCPCSRAVTEAPEKEMDSCVVCGCFFF